MDRPVDRFQSAYYTKKVDRFMSVIRRYAIMIGLEYLVKELNITFKDIANKLQISPKTINDWVKGRRKIPEQRKQELSEIFAGIEPELFQKEVTDEDKREIDFRTTLHKHDFIIRSIEKKRNIEGSYSAEDINNLVISLYYKMVLLGIDDKELGTKLDALKKFLYLMIEPYDKDIPHVLWEVIDNIFDVQDEYYYELTKLNRKYWDK